MNRRNDLQFPEFDISLKDLAKAGSGRLTRGLKELLSSSSNVSANPHQTQNFSRKKAKKSSDDEVVSGWRLQSYDFLSGQQDIGLKNRRLNRLRKHHLPLMCKLISPCVTANIEVQTTQLNANKSNSKDWNVKYFNRLKKVESESYLLGLQEPAVYNFTMQQFTTKFKRQLEKLQQSDIDLVFRSYCIQEHNTVRFPIVILQPLNFEEVNDVKFLLSSKVRDDMVKLSFTPPIPKVREQNYELTEEEQEKPLETFERSAEEEIKLEADRRILIWFIGTNLYCIQELSNPNIQHFNTISQNQWNRIFNETQFHLIKQDVSQCLINCNRVARLAQSELKQEDRRMFIHRLAKAKYLPMELCIILRFKQVEERRMILVKGLRNGELTWVPMQNYWVCYTMPQFNFEEMQFLYIMDSIPAGKDRESRILKLMLAQFYHEKVQFMDILKEYTEESEEEKYPRCLECHYILHTLPTTQCFHCRKKCHTKCLTPRTERPSFIVKGEALWCCENCRPCSVCFAPISDPLVCHECQARFHKQCGRTRDIVPQGDSYYCQDCLKCDMCSKKLKNCKQGYVLLEKRVICLDCHKLSGDYCNICMKSNANDEQKLKWFNCDRCEGWAHKTCDHTFLRTNAQYFQDQSSIYHCPKCRSQTKRELLKTVIEILKKFDEYQYFIDPAYEKLIDYFEIIEKPMCFKKMQEKCQLGYYDEQSYEGLSTDFNLIVNNALKYNMPKDLAHKSARIMKLMGEVTFNYMEYFINLSQLDLITVKELRFKMEQREKELFKYILNHYLEILLNKGNYKSKVVVKNRNASDLPEMLYFKHGELLKRFKNSQIELVYQKEQPKIEHLFRLPKMSQATKRSVTKALCYYHNTPQIVSWCDACCQAFCCTHRCLLHQTCSLCRVKGCGCFNWGCGCRAGYSQRDLDDPLFKDYDILTLTEVYKYCLRCCKINLKWRECKHCQKLCSFSYTKCIKCQRYFHWQCSPKTFIKDYCYECQHMKQNQNKLREQLRQETRKQLFRLTRAQKYVPLLMKFYLEEGIRLEAYQVRQLLLDQYDKIQEFLDQLELYETNFNQSQKNKVKEQKMKMMSTVVSQHLDQLKSQLRIDEVCKVAGNIDLTLVDSDGNSWAKDQFHRQISQNYFAVKNEMAVSDIEVDPMLLCEMSLPGYENPNLASNCHIQAYSPSYKQTMRHLYQTTPLMRPKQVIAIENRGPFIENKNMEVNYKKIQECRDFCRNLFMSFYYSLKQYRRVGSTSLVDRTQNSIIVCKKWKNSRPGIIIKLFREHSDEDRWQLHIDREVFHLRSYSELKGTLHRFRQFDSIEEIGNFLGFNINNSSENQYTYIKFLQNNPMDKQSFLERKMQVSQFYQKVKDNSVQKQPLFWLEKKSHAQKNVRRKKQAPYIQLEELISELDDQAMMPAQTVFRSPVPTGEIFIAPSTIHKLGLFSRIDHPKNSVIIEYVGEVLGEPIADIREGQYHFGCYMFGVPKRNDSPVTHNEDTIDENTSHVISKRDVIDATFRGNQARYLNHSCDPNCASSIEDHNGQPRIFIYAIRDIKQYEELTYDYQFKVSTEDDKIICTCGAKNCQGRLN